MTPSLTRRRPFRLGDWEVRPTESLVIRGDQTLRLEPRVMAVLVCLAEQPGRVVPHRELISSVWGGRHAIEDGVLPQAIHLLRRALGDDARDPTYIQTVPTRGYRLIAEVQPLDDPRIETPPSFGIPTGQLAGIVVVVVGVAVGIGFLLGRSGGRGRAGPARIEVLPFVNGSPEDEYLVAGVEHALRGQLSSQLQIRTIMVSPGLELRSPEALAARAERYGLEAIVAGTAKPTQSPDRVEVAIHVPGRRPRRVSIPLALERVTEGVDSATRAVCDALGIAMDRGARLDLGKDARVLELFFRGLNALASGRSPESTREGIEWLQRAVTIDPNHVPSLALLARLHLEEAHQGDRDRAYALAVRRAQEAIAIEPRTAEAHLALMRIMIEYRWHWLAAEEHFRRTIAINPSEWRAYFQHAWLLVIWKNYEPALLDLGRAMELSPGRPLLLSAKVKLLYLAERYDEAVTLGRELLDSKPPPPELHRALGRALLATGAGDEAVATMREGLELYPESRLLPLSALGHALAVTGHTAEAREILARFEQEFHTRPDRVALILVGLGEHEAALDALEEAHQVRAPGLVQIAVDPRFRPLAGNPRFHQLLDQLDLPPVRPRIP